MTGAAQLVEYSPAFVPVVATTWPKPLGKMDDLRYLRHTFVNARQRICFVVDDNEHLQFVQVQHVIGKRDFRHVVTPIPADACAR